MLSIERRRQVLHTLRTDHPDGRFSVEDAIRAAGGPEAARDTADEDELRTVLKTWQWRSIIAPAQPGVYRFRRLEGADTGREVAVREPPPSD